MGPKKKSKKELSASQLLSELTATAEAEGDGSSQPILTQASLEKALEKVINEHFNPTVKSLQDSLAEVTEVATNALKMVEIQKLLPESLLLRSVLKRGRTVNSGRRWSSKV